LRGFICGAYTSDERAWKYLSAEFDKHYPSMNGRKVYMYKEVPIKNQFTKGSTKLSDTLKAHDMGEIAGVKLTYANGNVFATPSKRHSTKGSK